MIALASDHGGYRLKEEIKKFLEDCGYEVRDLGTGGEDPVDYPDYAHRAAGVVARGECQLGILICGTGLGMSITANKVRGIRAALCHDSFSARMSREHNDASILCLGQRVVGVGLALEIVRVWLESSFAGDRHCRRVQKIENYEKEK